MSAAFSPKFPARPALLRVAPRPGDPADLVAFVVLPTAEELLGVPSLGRDPIVLPGHPRPLDGWALFGAAAGRALALN